MQVHSTSQSNKFGRPGYRRTDTGHLIEAGVPMPARTRPEGAGRKKALDLSGLKIGDSVYLKAGTKPAIARARTNAYNASKRAGVIVSARTVSGGIRVWRVA